MYRPCCSMRNPLLLNGQLSNIDKLFLFSWVGRGSLAYKTSCLAQHNWWSSVIITKLLVPSKSKASLASRLSIKLFQQEETWENQTQKQEVQCSIQTMPEHSNSLYQIPRVTSCLSSVYNLSALWMLRCCNLCCQFRGNKSGISPAMAGKNSTDKKLTNSLAYFANTAS